MGARDDPTLVLSGHGLRGEAIVRAAQGSVRIEADPDALAAVAALHEAARGAVRAYGRSTGVGGLAGEAVPAAEAEMLSVRLLRSHACGVGAPLPEAVVRGALVVRANQLLAAGAGVSPDLVRALLAAARWHRLPVVHELGGLGTADLTALAEIGLALIGEAPAGEPSGPPLRTLGPGEGLALLSSNAVSLARAALGLDRLTTVLESGDVVAGLAARALGASPEAFEPSVLAQRALPGEHRAAARVRALLGAQPAAPGAGAARRRIQDPYPLRCVPQLHGAALEALEDAWRHLEVECNGASENPLYALAGHTDPGQGRVAVRHHGGFLTLSLTLSLDRLRAALLSVGLGSTGRLGLLVDPARTGLRAFLATGPEGSSGVMLAEYVAQAALSRLRWAAAPATGWPVAVSLGTETLASWLPLSVEQLEMATDALAQVLGAELLAALRAARLSNHPLPAIALPLAALAVASGENDADAPLGGALEALAGAIRTGLGRDPRVTDHQDTTLAGELGRQPQAPLA